MGEVKAFKKQVSLTKEQAQAIERNEQMRQRCVIQLGEMTASFEREKTTILMRMMESENSSAQIISNVRAEKKVIGKIKAVNIKGRYIELE